MADVALLGPAQIRELAARLGIRPTKKWGQNFVIDPNTVTRIVRLAGVNEADTVVEVGPGLGSLTLALLARAGHVTVIEVDPVLAEALPRTVRSVAPGLADRLDLVCADAMRVEVLPGPAPTRLVANLPYNVSVPVVLRFLEKFPSIEQVLVMVQLEVAERLAAAPGSRVYGAPSVKAAWYGTVRLAGTVARSVFWPVPNVDSGLVSVTRRPPPRSEATREEVFSCIDAAFSQRRKTLRAALASWAGSPQRSEDYLVAAGVDPRRRGEELDVHAYAAIAGARVRAERSSAVSADGGSGGGAQGG